MTNYGNSLQLNNLPIPLELYAGQDLNQKREAALVALQKETGEVTEESADLTATLQANTTVTKTIITKKTIIVTMTSDGKGSVVTQDASDPVDDAVPAEAAAEEEGNGSNGEDCTGGNGDDGDDDGDDDDDDLSADAGDASANMPPQHSPVVDSWGSSESVFLGLRVYTHQDAPAIIGGQLNMSSTSQGL